MTAKREFFSTNEVAQTLGISPFTIRRYIRLRMLKALKLEGSYRVRRGDLEKFLKARELETEEELDALEVAEEEPPPSLAKSRLQGPARRAQAPAGKRALAGKRNIKSPPAAARRSKSPPAGPSEEQAASIPRRTAPRRKSRSTPAGTPPEEPAGKKPARRQVEKKTNAEEDPHQ